MSIVTNKMQQHEIILKMIEERLLFASRSGLINPKLVGVINQILLVSKGYHANIQTLGELVEDIREELQDVAEDLKRLKDTEDRIWLLSEIDLLGRVKDVIEKCNFTLTAIFYTKRTRQDPSFIENCKE